MMTKQEIDHAIDHFEEMAKLVMGMQRHHDPMMIIFADSGVGILTLAPIMAAAEEAFKAGQYDQGYAIKARMADTMHAACKAEKAFGTIFIMDSYVSRVKEPSLLNLDDMPRNDPERTEAINVYYEFKLEDGSKYQDCRIWPYKRQDGRIIFGQRERMGVAGGGAMTNFIQ